MTQMEQILKIAKLKQANPEAEIRIFTSPDLCFNVDSCWSRIQVITEVRLEPVYSEKDGFTRIWYVGDELTDHRSDKLANIDIDNVSPEVLKKVICVYTSPL